MGAEYFDVVTTILLSDTKLRQQFPSNDGLRAITALLTRPRPEADAQRFARPHHIFATKLQFQQTRLVLRVFWQNRELILESNQGTECLRVCAGLREDESVAPYQVNDQETFPPYARTPAKAADEYK